jgi:hydrogenase maturation factor
MNALSLSVLHQITGSPDIGQYIGVAFGNATTKVSEFEAEKIN